MCTFNNMLWGFSDFSISIARITNSISISIVIIIITLGDLFCFNPLIAILRDSNLNSKNKSFHLMPAPTQFERQR